MAWTVASVSALWVANCGKTASGRVEQFPRAGEVGDVGVDLAREDRKAFEAVDLRALDLAVPVGALDQPHHEAAGWRARELDEPVDHERRALLIGLHDEADAVPAGELGIAAQRLEQIERKVEPLGFLGVDVEADVVARRAPPALQPRQQFAHHALALARAIARMQRRELDRDAGPFVDAAARARPRRSRAIACS